MRKIKLSCSRPANNTARGKVQNGLLVVSVLMSEFSSRDVYFKDHYNCSRVYI